jgi:tetratricopeptide repeat protein 30
LALQESKFKEALKYYEMIVQKHTDNILNVSAIVLANLCVSYIMTSQVSTAPSVPPGSTLLSF